MQNPPSVNFGFVIMTQPVSAIAMKEGSDPEEYITSCKEQWKENYERGTEIWSDIVRKRTGLEYKGKLRSEIEIKLK